jgi:thiamine monophosphate synthase
LKVVEEMTKKICEWMFGALLAVMLVPAAVASADNTDAEFISYLDGHGIHLGTASQTVNMAHAMCHDLTAGYTQRDEVDQLLGAQRLNPAQAQVFVGAATADYCPSNHPASPPHAG